MLEVPQSLKYLKYSNNLQDWIISSEGAKLMSNRQIWTSSEEEFLKKNFESMTNIIDINLNLMDGLINHFSK